MKQSKLALVKSIIALCLCVSMLAGTTFAWFTDSVSSQRNQIATGTLDVELEYLADDGNWKSVQDSSEILDKDALWEPGYTDAVYLRVANKGSLALQYYLGVNIISEVTSKNKAGAELKLSDYIRFGVVENVRNRYEFREDARNAVVESKKINEGYTKNGNILVGGDEQYVALVVYMPEDTGNEANYADGQTPPAIDLGISVAATQYSTEADSFGSDYDNQSQFPSINLNFVTSAAVTTTDDGKVESPVSLTSLDGGITAYVPEGVQLEEGVTEVTFSLRGIDNSTAEISLEENEISQSVDVHIEGISEDNTVPILVTVKEMMPVGLNIGNYKFYHVEDGITNLMTLVDVPAAHNEFSYDPATGDVTMMLQSFSEVAMVADTVNAWNGDIAENFAGGTGETTDPYIIANADQLAYLNECVSNDNENYESKHYKLIADINLGGEENANEGIIWYPIGYHKEGGTIATASLDDEPDAMIFDDTETMRGNVIATVADEGISKWYTYGGAFKGTFDGNGHKISNIYQNTWQLKGNYDGNYWNAAMGLFGYVYGGTIKNLTVDNFQSDGEFTPTGVVAAYAAANGEKEAKFENIAITNCNPRVYNTGNGGIVGIGGNTSDSDKAELIFTNITIDNSNIISALWGSWDVACGGLVGMFRGAGHVYMTNCHVAAQIDVFNDVCGNYQYYWYRYSGMMVGTNKNMITDEDGYTVPETSKFHAKDCTVHFGEWNNYWYCELVANSLASYTHDHQFSRLTQVDSVDVDHKTVTVAGKTTAIPTSGRVNYVVATKDEKGYYSTGNATCYHFVNGTEWTHDKAGTEVVNGKEVLKEDNAHIYLPFNQLFTGYGWGVKHIPVYNGEDYAFKGITILDRKTADSVVKFASTAKETYMSSKLITIGDLFEEANIEDPKLSIKDANVQVTVSPVGTESTVSAEYIANTTDWTQGTLIFNGEGKATITISDYYFCTPTTIVVTIEERTAVEKFESKFKNDYLYRVGNENAVSLGTLFEAVAGEKIGTVSVAFETISGNACDEYTENSTWTNGTIKFNGTGVVKVTITDNVYCIPTVLYLEVIDAINATSATSATSNNVVLLKDCEFSSLEVSGGYTLYGNGFTMTCSSDAVAIDRTYSFIELKGGTLDNVKIVTPNFSHAIMYEKNKTENGNPSNTDSSGRTRYYNIRSAVLATGNNKITNSYISGGRVAIYATSGKLTVENSTIYGGAVANIQAEASSNLILRDVTLIQKPIKATVNDTSKTLMGLSVVMMCDTTGIGTPVTLEGYLHQYAWANKDYKSYVPSDAESVVTDALSKPEFVHSITYEDGVTRDSICLGFAYMPNDTVATTAGNMTDNRTTAEKNKIKYETTTVSKIASIYTYKNTSGTDTSVKSEPTYNATVQGMITPKVSYSDVNENRIFTTVYDATKGQWKSTLKVDIDAGNYDFNFDNLKAQKNGVDLNYTVTTENGDSVDTTKSITLDSAVSNVYNLTITDNQIYDKNGENINTKIEHTYIFELLATKTSLPAPVWTSIELNGTPYIVVDSKGGDWNCAVPVLDGLQVKYWSKKQNKEKELDLTNVVSVAGLSNGTQNGSNNTITITVADEYTLKITTTGFKTNDNGKPVVVGGKLYFTVSSSSNYVSTSTTDRTPNISYVFTDANNSDPITLSTSFNVKYDTYKSKQYNYSDFCKGKLTEATCVTPETLITLADGTVKPVYRLTGNEELLVWNLETGSFDSAPIMFLDSEEEAEFEVINLKFSDGTTVGVISEHGFWDYDLNKYVYLDRNAADYIGHTFAKKNGNELKAVELVDVVLETRVTTAWSPVTVDHLCYFVDGMLSMPGGVGGLFNIFDVDAETMTYDFEAMAKDIETYGLYTYEEISELVELPEAMFDAAGGKYLKVSIGKGNMTEADLVNMITRYTKYF